MKWRQVMKNLVCIAGQLGQELKNAFRELITSIRSIDRDRIPDPKKVIKELKKTVRSIIGAGKEKLAELWEAIQDLKNAISTIVRENMPDMQNVFNSIGEWWLDLRNTIRCIDFGRGITWLIDLGKKARDAIGDKNSLTLDKAAEIIAGLGIPGLVLIVLMAASPWFGAAAITASLAVLGPFGMLGGIAVLLVLVLIAKALAKFGFGAVFQKHLKGLKEEGKTIEEILETIASYPISNELKRKLREFIEKYSEENDDDEENNVEDGEEEDSNEQRCN